MKIMEIRDRTGLAGAAVNEIRAAILEGRLVQGERISEVTLSNTLGVSRAPVREALLHLEQEGLVVSLPYKGASVVTLTPQDFLELSTLRIALEKLAWARAMEKPADNDLTAMSAIIDEMRTAVASGQKAKLVRLDLDFHEQVFLLADHSRLYTAWQAIKWQVALFLLTRRVKVDDYDRIIVQEHADLLAMLVNQRSNLIDQTIANHIESGYDRLNNQLADDASEAAKDAKPKKNKSGKLPPRRAVKP